jgi:hypothetical protein
VGDAWPYATGAVAFMLILAFMLGLLAVGPK